MDAKTSDDRLRFSIGSLAMWLVRLLRRWRSGARYLLLCPEFVERQVVYDRRSRSLFKVRLRDRIDLAVLQQVYRDEHYSLARLRRHAELLKDYQDICARGSIPLILDLGANSGLAARYFAQNFPEARVVAVEPAADNVDAARRNLAEQSNVKVICAAAANATGAGRLIDPARGNWGYRIELAATGEVELVTVPSLIRAEGQRCVPFIIKIDIEGFEENLFAENVDWVSQFPLLMIELHDWMLPGRAVSANLLRCLAPLDRDFVVVRENIFSIANRKETVRSSYDLL